MDEIKWSEKDKERAKKLTAYQMIKKLYEEGKITEEQMIAIKQQNNIDID